MRILAFSFLFSLICLAGNTQTPNGFTYQAVVRNNNGIPLTDMPVKLRFSILGDAQGSNILYQELFETTTNNIGLVNLVVGEGNPVLGNYEDISWKNSNYLKVEMDVNNSGTYELMGINRLQSVPYALYANDAHHSTYADTAFYVKTISGDRTTKLLFGSAGISTNNGTGYVVSDLSKSLLDFNVSDYQNVASVNFCVIAKSGNPANNFIVELFDLNSNQVIANSSISGNNTDYQLLKSQNLVGSLPESTTNLSIRIKSGNGQDYVSVQKVYLLMQKGKLAGGSTLVQGTK